MDEKEKENKSPALYCLDIISAIHERERRNILIALVIIVVVMAFAICAVSIINRATIADLTESMNEQNEKWIDMMSEYDFESYELSTEGGGNANYIGNDGDIYNGKSSRPKTD